MFPFFVRKHIAILQKLFHTSFFKPFQKKGGPFSRENNEFKLFSLKVGQAVSQGISTQRP